MAYIGSEPISPVQGGTGAPNLNTSTITIGGALRFLGAFTFTATLTANTSVTFPTSGTLATTSQIPSLPVAVTDGGTSRNSLTNHAVIVGNATSPVTLVGPSSTSGAIFIGQGSSADPTYSAFNTIDANGNLSTQNSVAGNSLSYVLSNTSTTAGSQAIFQISTGVGSGASDPLILYGIGVAGQRWSEGIDQSDSSSFKICAGAGIGVNEFFKITTSGVITISNAYTLPTTAGTSGYVMTTNGTTTASWAAPAASSVTFTGDSGTPFSGAAVTVTGASTGLTFAASTPNLTLGGTLAAVNGGTGFATISTGEVLQASGSNVIGKFGAKLIIQQIRNSTQTPSSTSTTIPYDTSKPQSTEGAQIFSQAITPTNASNILRIYGVFSGASGVNFLQLALFQDAGTDAIAAWSSYSPATTIGSIPFDFYMVAGTTSSTTFALRYGSDAGSGYLNQSSAGVTLGGVLTTTMFVEEIQV